MKEMFYNNSWPELKVLIQDENWNFICILWWRLSHFLNQISFSSTLINIEESKLFVTTGKDGIKVKELDRKKKDTENLIKAYDILDTGNPYDINTHDDTIVNYHFEVDPKIYHKNTGI